ncbi:amidase [Siminovitchia sediminis]|uniref:Amidase n=1 Tax=Siminovitchia sediminis TaxID=1274353 RepID=A0ABW4KGV7_9BACI
MNNQNIKKIEEKNGENNAFISVSSKIALEEAKNAEKEILSGNYRGPLHGIPLALKDNISVKSLFCTNGSIIDKNNMAHNDAFLVKQLRHEGAIIVGKTNLDEYANHVIGMNRHYGIIKNPINNNHTAGGSSGGSAVSVALNLSYGAIGTDTSGSVRIPAACCGIVGLKPTYNLIPTEGVTPLSWSLDHVGILAKDCNDVSILLRSLLVGSKETSTNLDPPMDISQLTIGVPENYFFEMVDEMVEKKIREVINIFISQGARVKYINIPNVEQALMAQEDIIGAEGAFLHKFQLEDHKGKYEEGNYEYFKHGLTITRSKYEESLIIRQRLNRDFQQIFNSVDILLTPTLPITAPKLTAEKVTWGNYEEDILTALSRFTGPFNVTGLPALSVPLGIDMDGLPIGLQIVGNMYSENKIVSVGKWIMDQMR